MTPAGFPHSEILGSQFVCQLPEAYRRLLRPSSAPSAKASIVCPYKLDHRYSKMLASTVQFSSYGRAPQLSSAYLDERGGSSGADGPSCRPRGQTEEGPFARSLRTQQCAWLCIPSVVFQSGEPDVLTRADCTTTGRCSTLEQPPRDMCSSCGPGRLAAPDAP